MVWTSLAPSLKSKEGKLVGAGAAMGAAVGADAAAGAGFGAAAMTGLGRSAGLGGSIFVSGGFSLGGSGFFSLGTMVTVNSFSFLPRMPKIEPPKPADLPKPVMAA